ncbi:hypothetical protein T492DRAFT_1138408, partial [Pavlovales sp. CCMP2436]
MTAELPHELIYRIAYLALGSLARTVCTEANAVVNVLVRTLTFAPDAPKAVVQSRAARCVAVTKIRLVDVLAVDDMCLAKLLTISTLSSIDVSGCSMLTPLSLARLRASPVDFAARRCWRMWRPSPELGPREVIELQVLALRDNSAEGIQAAFDWASPANQAFTGPASRFGRMIASGFSIMLTSSRARVVCPDDIDEKEVHAKVLFLNDTESETPGRYAAVQTFEWVVSKQEEGDHRGCWMTDAVIPINAPRGTHQPTI